MNSEELRVEIAKQLELLDQLQALLQVQCQIAKRFASKSETHFLEVEFQKRALVELLQDFDRADELYQ